MNIGSLFLSLLSDGSKLEPMVVDQATKAGKAGSEALGKSLGSTLKAKGVAAIGTTLAAGFALATKGALELSDIQAQYQAETGASAEEAARAAKVINSAAGDSQLALSEVADAAVKVHNDLGATGDAADVLTRKFAEFAHVTKQNAGAAVSSFDDILDAWGLTAQDAGTVMDKLIVSHQRYGGSIEENEKALATFAPQLTALGATIDDGIGLLNLFAASGIDAGKATQALNTAVKNLKPGQTIDDLVRQISAIEDPTKRAQAAIKVFGARGGVALANALKPGINGLSDFAISAQDAAGATDKAADQIDASIGGRIRKAVSQAQAAVRGFGADFGPALTGLASAVSLVGATGIFNGFGSKFASGLVGSVKGAAGAIESGLTSVVGPPIARAIFAMQTNPTIQSALSKVGTFMGSTLGKALGAGITVAIADQAGRATGDAVNGFFTDQIKAAVARGDSGNLRDARAQLQEKMDSILFAPFKVVDVGGVQAGFKRSLDEIDAGLAEIATQNASNGGLAKVQGAITGAIVGTVTAGMEAAQKPITDVAGDNLAKGMLAAQTKADAAGRTLGGAVPDSIVEGVHQRENVVSDALAGLVDLMKNTLGRQGRIARDIGILTGEELRKGLNSKREGVRQEAARVQAITEQELAHLILQGGRVGEKAMTELQKGLKSKNPAVRAAAQHVQSIVDNALAATVKPAAAAGANAASAYSTALLGGVSRALAQARITTAAKKHDESHRAGGGPVRAGVPYLVNEGTARSETFVPATAGRVVTYADSLRAIAAAGGGGGGGDTFQITVPVTGVLRAETPADVARPMREIVRSGVVRSRRSRSRVEVPTR